MPNVTVLGSNGSATVTVTIPYGTGQNTTIAQSLADGISQAVLSSALTPVYVNSGSIPAVSKAASLNIGAIDGTTPLATGLTNFTMPLGYNAVIDNASNAVTITGNGGLGQPISVLAGAGGLTFHTGDNNGIFGNFGTGSGTVVAAGGSNVLTIDPTTVTGGAWLAALGNGSNTIVAASGTNTFFGGTGSNSFDLTGTSSDFITLQGSDTITATSGTGHDTISVGGSSATTTLVNFASTFHGGVVFSNNNSNLAASATVNGGGGSATLFGGLGKSVFTGGTAGNNFIQAGLDGASSVFGGGDGDRLYAGFFGGGTLKAGVGNETLFGAGNVRSGGPPNPFATGSNFIASSVSGGSSIYAGTGADTITVGVGNEFINGTPSQGGDLYVFFKGITSTSGASTGASADVTIKDFTVGKDTVSLQSYGYTSVSDLLTHVVVAGGNSTLTLSDGTTVEFLNVTNLSEGQYKLS